MTNVSHFSRETCRACGELCADLPGGGSIELTAGNKLLIKNIPVKKCEEKKRCRDRVPHRISTGIVKLPENGVIQANQQ
jgi:hypothetical protein